jgi:hypothetical protein
MHTSPLIHNGFLLLACLFFFFDGARLFISPKVSWTPLGFACVVAAFLFPFFV